MLRGDVLVYGSFLHLQNDDRAPPPSLTASATSLRQRPPPLQTTSSSSSLAVGPAVSAAGRHLVQVQPYIIGMQQTRLLHQPRLILKRYPRSILQRLLPSLKQQQQQQQRHRQQQQQPPDTTSHTPRKSCCKPLRRQPAAAVQELRHRWSRDSQGWCCKRVKWRVRAGAAYVA